MGKTFDIEIVSAQRSVAGVVDQMEEYGEGFAEAGTELTSEVETWVRRSLGSSGFGAPEAAISHGYDWSTR